MEEGGFLNPPDGKQMVKPGFLPRSGRRIDQLNSTSAAEALPRVPPARFPCPAIETRPGTGFGLGHGLPSRRDCPLRIIATARLVVLVGRATRMLGRRSQMALSGRRGREVASPAIRCGGGNAEQRRQSKGKSGPQYRGQFQGTDSHHAAPWSPSDPAISSPACIIHWKTQARQVPIRLPQLLKKESGIRKKGVQESRGMGSCPPLLPLLRLSASA